MTDHPVPNDRTPGGHRLSPTWRVLLAMLAGAVVGWLFPDGATGRWHAAELQVVSTLFLRLVKTLIVPLLFGTLVVGIAGHGDDLRQVGRLALRAFCYFEVITTLALGVGLLVVNLARPGLGVHLPAAGGPTAPAATLSLTTMLESMVPQSFFEAAARNEALPVTLCAILFGVALTGVAEPARGVMLAGCESLVAVMFRVVTLVMRLAPLGVGAAIAVTVAHNGPGVLRQLGALVLTLYGALAIFAVLVLLPVALLARVPLRRFLQAVQGPWLLAFSTASSEAALPLALANMERLGVPRRVASFVLPAGYAFNMDGTTLYLALASGFVAQAAGIRMPLSTQLLMLVTLMLTSKGVAGVPRSSLVVLSATLTQFGLPLEGIGLILGVDALMDMARTSLNVVGNCLASVVLARWEGSFGLPPIRTAPAAPGPGAAFREAAIRVTLSR